ncbi:hypothetical protein J5226_07600 [Lysobacter sp. K5869]|uniref:hypothetical protein n=1 Tax=Lysobacter sp. K5869 TaxID=2820808 RepID=UPI001C05FDFF|nr:hypothetical protein [Lysobacter sp. K5869]QWP78248.1 hypothetical protein J5226_07600 [Lysobacter sp. K5869]
MSNDVNQPQNDIARPLARIAARELSVEEIAAISGGKGDTTHATGPNGDDPGDPDLL